jgi:hypothetical protein
MYREDTVLMVFEVKDGALSRYDFEIFANVDGCEESKILSLSSKAELDVERAKWTLFRAAGRSRLVLEIVASRGFWWMVRSWRRGRRTSRWTAAGSRSMNELELEGAFILLCGPTIRRQCSRC